MNYSLWKFSSMQISRFLVTWYIVFTEFCGLYAVGYIFPD